MNVRLCKHELQLPHAGEYNMHFTALYTAGEGIQLPAWKEINLRDLN
jgi:hypothetical protein